MTAATRVARGVAALAALAALVIGVPLLLVVAVGWPLPHGAVTLSDVTDALNGSTPVPDSLWFGALACIGWIMWLRVTIAATVETHAALAGHPAGDHGIRRALAPLIAAAMLTISVPRHLSAAAPARPLPPVAAIANTPTPSLPPPASSIASSSTWTVARNDTLWSIAERSLGDPLRWPDIYALNEGQPQPDGTSLRDPGLLRPGWTLTLPADSRPATGPGPGSVTVEPGDTLSGIAQHTLGDPSRYFELFAATADLTQPDGQHLTDPNLIRPGWQIELPTRADPPAPVLPTTVAAPAVAASSAPPTTPSAGTPETTFPGGQPAAAPSARSSDQKERGSAPFALFATAGSAVTAAAVLAALRGRRRRQRALRPPSARLPVPNDEATEHEQLLRITSDDDALAWVDITNRLLGLALTQIEEPPEVVLVRAGVLGVEVLLDRAADPLRPFVAGGSPQSWQLSPTFTLEDATAYAAEGAIAVPTLVSIGTTHEGTVLLNLEHAATVEVAGDTERVAAWLRGAALELACAPWATDLPVHTAGFAIEGPDTADVHVAVSAAEAIAAIGAHAARLRCTLNGVAPRVARLRDHPNDAWHPAVALIADATQDCLPADAGEIIVTTAPAPGPWRVTIEPDGLVTVAPLGLQLYAVGIAAATAAATGELIRAAEVRPEPIAPRPAEPHASRGDAAINVEEALAPTPVEVRVLRPSPEVDGWANPDRLRGKAAELVVYLAMADGSVGSQRIRNDLWGGELVTNDTWKSTNSRARAALGIGADGVLRLPHAETSRFQLTDEVGCDWRRFQRLAELAQGADCADAITYLRAALRLVDGPPFSDCGSRYRWAENRLHEIDRCITDAAHQLAELAMAEGDHELATWATERGHLANPEQQSLFDDRMLARALAGDERGVRQTYDAMRSALRRIDPLAEIPDDSARAYADAVRLATVQSDRAVG